MKAKSAHLTHPKYRADIDGLRAIAVLSVVGYHAFPSWVKGGFIGVDIFFVISGFLISTILFENLASDTFSFTEFYTRRIKRIFPALLIVLISCFAFGWFVLLADEYKQLGKHIAGGAGFISNIILWKESGYFDNAADVKPLLHLWSLGIEEQFYIIWPLLLWAAWKKRFSLLIVTIVIALISFVLNIIGVCKDVVATFYSPHTRFWELLCGSLLAWLMLNKQIVYASLQTKSNIWLSKIFYWQPPEAKSSTLSSAQSMLGSLLIAIGIYRISENTDFPGTWALLPTLGAVLIISAGTQTWINRAILSNRVLVFFGLISFPLYLWHWPLLSFARIIEGGTPSRNIRIAAIAISIVFAWITYRLLERPIRFGRNDNVKTILLVLMMSIVGYIGYNTYQRDGVSPRNKDRSEFVNYFNASYPKWEYFKTINLDKEWRAECAYFNGEKYRKEGSLEGGVTNSKPVEKLAETCYVRDNRYNKSVLIWGDSHAQALSSGVVHNIPKNWQVLQVATSGCIPNPYIDVPSITSQCNQSNYFAMRTIKDALPDVVVVAQANGHKSKMMIAIAEKLKGMGVKKVLFIGPTPQWTSNLPKLLARKLWPTIPCRTSVGINHDIFRENNELAKELKTNDLLEYINLISFFCNRDGCLTYTGNDLKTSITTWDYGHLTPSASDYLAKNILIDKIVGP